MSRLRRRVMRASVRLRRNVLWICAAIVLLGAVCRPVDSPRRIGPIVDPEAFVKAHTPPGKPKDDETFVVVYNLADLFDAQLLEPPIGCDDLLPKLNACEDSMEIPPYVFARLTGKDHVAYVKQLNKLRSELK